MVPLQMVLKLTWQIYTSWVFEMYLKIFSPLLLHIFEEKLGQCKVKRTKGQKTKISKDLKMVHKNGT